MGSLNIIQSKGPLQNTYSILDTEFISNPDTIVKQIINSNNIIWIRNGSYDYTTLSDLDIFSNNLDSIQKPIVLITSDGDRRVPNSYSTSTVWNILNHEKILMWYTQNYDNTITHAKLKPLPIGLDLHSKHMLINNTADNKLNFFVNLRKLNTNKIKNKIFSDTHLSLNSYDRTYLYNELKNNKNIDFLDQRVPCNQILRIYNNYQFVLSPHGRGLDCHRTWELFMLGCIVIVKKSSLDTMYNDHNLPVIILDNWEELNIDLSDKLDKWYHDKYHLTSIENIYLKMSYQYWLPNVVIS
jgi:hypothetical protein